MQGYPPPWRSMEPAFGVTTQHYDQDGLVWKLSPTDGSASGGNSVKGAPYAVLVVGTTAWIASYVQTGYYSGGYLSGFGLETLQEVGCQQQPIALASVKDDESQETILFFLDGRSDIVSKLNPAAVPVGKVGPVGGCRALQPQALLFDGTN